MSDDLLERLYAPSPELMEWSRVNSELRREAAATIERLTKELEEARLHDSNQWRREYWKHYNDLKARADSLAAELAKANERTAAAVDDYNDALAELAKAREALTLAVNMVMVNEPGDSRAVSPEAVALAAVVAGCDDQACWDVIRAALPATPEPQT